MAKNTIFLRRPVISLLLGFLLFPLPLRAQDSGSAPSGEDRLLDLETTVNTEEWRSQVQEKLEQAPLEPEAFSVSGARHPEKVSQAPAAIFAVGSQAAELARREFPEVPLVFSMVLNTEPYLGQENTTGIAMKIHPRDQLRAFKNILPRIRRIGVIYDPVQNRSTIAEAQVAAREMGLTLLEKRVSDPREIANAIKDLMYVVDALWMIPDQTVVSKESFRYMLEATLNRKIPILTFSQSFVKGGALLALAPNYQDMGRQAGRLVQKILGGSSPGSLPSAHPQGYLFLNLNTASALSINIPADILQKAEKIQ